MVQRPRYCRGKREERPAAQVTGCTSDTPDSRGKKEIASNGRFYNLYNDHGKHCMTVPER